MHVATRIFLLSVVDEVVQIARKRAVAASGDRIKPASCMYGDVGCLLHSLLCKSARCLDTQAPLTADPGDDGRPFFVIAVPAGVAAGNGDGPMREPFQVIKANPNINRLNIEVEFDPGAEVARNPVVASIRPLSRVSVLLARSWASVGDLSFNPKKF